jgi:proteic killer suppression protein
MIKSFRHKGLKNFFESENKAGIQPAHANRLRRQLRALDDAVIPSNMDYPGWGFHRLVGDLVDFYAVSVSGNWRLVFKFENGDAILVDYLDYH